MALDRELRRLLEEARLPETESFSSRDGDILRPTARGIFDRLLVIHQQTCVPSMGVTADMNLPELLVLVAEAAVYQGDFGTASNSVEWFFAECQLKNQFYCRAQFVRAHCGSHDAQVDTGAAKLKKVLNAIHFILTVLPIATDARKRPVYDFLVYNASVAYWQVARQLMKQSTFQFLVPSLTKILDALKLTGESDVAWLLRLQIALVYAQIDANQLANAAKTINDVVDVQLTPRPGGPANASNESFRALFEEALQLQVHVGSFKDPECQKIVPNVKRLLPPNNKRASLLVKLQCIKSGNLTGTLEAAYVEIIQEATGFLGFGAETSLNDVRTFIGFLEPRAVEAVDAQVLAETAIHAAFNNVLPIAAACEVVLERKGKTMPPKARVLSQVLNTLLLVMTPLTHTGSKINSRQRQSILVARRVGAMKALERALVASQRQQDPQLVETVCICTWNLSLPLLQPHLRLHMTRVFSVLSSIMEELDSLLLGVRARLYLEIAKLEVASEFLAKASENINKALALDYGTITRVNNATMMTVELLSAHEEWIARPVDMHLLPIKQKLDLKLAPENSRSRAVEVLALLEQFKECKDLQQQRRIFTRCIERMTKINNASTSASPAAAVDHVRLWSEIAALAWRSLHDGALAQHTAETALSAYFSLRTGDVLRVLEEKSMMILEVDLRLLLVEILAEKIKDQAILVDDTRHQTENTVHRMGKEAFVLGMHRPHAETSTSPLESDAEGAEVDANIIFQARQSTFDKEILALKSEILEHLTRALKVATTIGWTFVLENTCIYLWNYHFHIFRMLLETSRTGVFDPQWLLPDCVSAFEAVYAALEAVAIDVDSDLLANIGLGLSSIYKKTGRLDKALAIADTFLRRKTLTDSKGGTMSVLHLKRFAELRSRVQLAQNTKEITLTDSTIVQVKVVAYLEAMEVTFSQILGLPAQQSQLLEKAQGFYQKSIAMWQPNALDIFTSLMSEEFDRRLEEEQELMELHVEISVRLGCGALRLNKIKTAIDCAEQALIVLRSGEGKKSKQKVQLLVEGGTWKWLALAELLYGRAILTLSQGDTPAQKLVLAALTHLVRAIEYSLRGNIVTIIVRACEIIWNATISTINHNFTINGDETVDDNFLDHIVTNLHKTLRYLDQILPSSAIDVNFYGEMVLLTLAVCAKAKKWTNQFEICGSVLKTFGSTSAQSQLPIEIMREVQTALAISGAHLGKPSSLPKIKGSSNSPDERQDSLVQAQILNKVAFSSWKDPPGQLRALSNAYIELDGQPEQQALALVDIAEWFYTNQFPTQTADAYLECATSTLLTCQTQKVSQTAMSRKASTGQLSVASRKSNVVYSALWFAEKQLRIFVMRAKLSKACTERSKHVRLALYEVEKAWEHVFLLANELEFQALYDRETSGVEFDEWKKDKPLKYTQPGSEREWIDFFMEHESATTRFYMSWAKTLQSVATTNIVHITQPVLTLIYLEELLVMLREDGLQYSSMISPFGLYTVVYHAYIPERSYLAQIWMELVQFSIMERLNLKNFSLPLQNALDMMQSHVDTLIQELQEAPPCCELPEGDVMSRKRRIFHSTHLDTRVKTAVSIRLLLQFGFVRQAKTLLEILQYSIASSSGGGDNNASSTVWTSECQVLASHVLEIEGQHEWALARVKSALDTPQLDVCRFIEWTLRCCKLTPDLNQSLRILQAAEKQAAQIVVAGIRRPVPPTLSSVSSSSPDLTMVQLLARVTFKQALILLKKAGAAQGSRRMNHLQESKRALDKSIQMLALVNAQYQHSELLLKFSRALLSFEQQDGGVHLACVDFDARNILQDALALQEKCLERQFCGLSSSQQETQQRESIVVLPLRLKIALTKLQVARLLMASELSPAVLKDKEMTWYRYHDETRRTIVEKWLNATRSGLEEQHLVELPRAMTLLTSAIDTLSGNATLETHHAFAQVLRLQCQRLALFHGTDRQNADAIQTHLWTRYTSSDARHETWVCCYGAGSELAASTSQSAAPTQENEQAADEKKENKVDEARLDEILITYAANLQKYQLIAFEKQSAELRRLCSNELVQVLGCRHPFECAKNVLEHQSAEVIEVASALFEKCVSESNVQRLHLKRMEKLQKTHTSAAAHSLPFQLSQVYLMHQSESFKRMSVGNRVDDIVAALPSPIRVMCLHFSPDRCFLYAALLGNTEKCVAMARMEFTDAQTALLEQLQRRVHKWRVKCAKETLVYEEAHGQDERYEFTSIETPVSSSVNLPVSHGDVLEDEFTTILNETIELLNPLFTHSAMKAECVNLAGNTVVLLLDRVLACLPMEALPVFQSAEAVARDFSIQLLYHRIMAMKKQPLRPNEIRVIVDPYQEDTGNPSGQTITSVVKQASGAWKDACDHGQVPSVTDWQQALLAHRGGGLVYMGPNRVLGSSLPLRQVTGMNVALTCQAMILLDHAENSKSIRRQSKLDSEKPAWEKEIEGDAYARALLLTLCGVNVLTMNQWATTFNDNRRLANGFLQNLSRGYNVGKALKKLGESTMVASPSATSLTATAADPAPNTSRSPSTGPDCTTGGKLQLKNRFRYNPVVYGLATLILKSND